MSATYRVVGPLAIIKGNDGKLRYLYSPATLSGGDYPSDELTRLVEAGLLEKYTPNVQTELQEQSGGTSGSSGGSGDERPAKAALKEAWVDYAVAQGMDRDEAEATSKDDLIAKYGG